MSSVWASNYASHRDLGIPQGVLESITGEGDVLLGPERTDPGEEREENARIDGRLNSIESPRLLFYVALPVLTTAKQGLKCCSLSGFR